MSVKANRMMISTHKTPLLNAFHNFPMLAFLTLYVQEDFQFLTNFQTTADRAICNSRGTCHHNWFHTLIWKAENLPSGIDAAWVDGRDSHMEGELNAKMTSIDNKTCLTLSTTVLCATECRQSTLSVPDFCVPKAQRWGYSSACESTASHFAVLHVQPTSRRYKK